MKTAAAAFSSRLRPLAAQPQGWRERCGSCSLPLLGCAAAQGEELWAPGLRAFLYAIAMIYMFLGIAIVSDMFMAAIEVWERWRVQQLRLRATHRLPRVADAR